jgi:hypothetical protein
MNWSARGNVLNQYFRNTSIGTTVNIFEIFSYQVSCFIFQHNNNLFPQAIASLFTVNSEMHHHNTRQKT